MTRSIAFAFLAATLCRTLLAADTQPAVMKQIDPNQGRSNIGVVFDTAEVELVMDAAGVPFSLESSLGLPDYVVQAFCLWRYSPARVNDKPVDAQTTVTVDFTLSR